MYPPPQDLETTVFARIPDKFHRKNRSSAWAEMQRPGLVTDCFIEGPSFDRQGFLYLVDIAHGRIFRISPDGGDIEIAAQYDGQPNGLKIHKDGRIFIADFQHGIMVMKPGSGHIEPFLTPDGPDHFKGVNDLVFASNGDLYFTDQGLTGMHDATGRLYCLRAREGSLENGDLECLVDTVPSPNGLVLNIPESMVYLNVTRANSVWRVPMMAGGGVMKVGNFIQLSGGLGGPDGLAIDEKGNLAVAHFGMGSVWIFSPLGEPLYRIRSCEGLATTNIAYGGPDRRTLYITESDSGTVLQCRLPVPGRAMYSHA